MGIGVVLLVVWHNLVSNSVYYAKHMPHKEGTEPELVMLMDNYFWLPEPKEIIYKDKGGISVRKNVPEGLPLFVKSTTYINGKQEYFFVNNGVTYIYVYDEKFRLDFAYTRETLLKDGLDLTTIDQKRVMLEIYELVQPILDVQKPPLINLQWLFNWLYHDELN